MTRLTTEWIKEMEAAAMWNEKLKARTGLGYIDVASRTSGKNPEEIKKASESMMVAVIPITSGLGIIGNFSESIAAIVGAMGFRTFVTEKTDVDGIYEAYIKKADIIMMADDNRYIALNLKNGKIGDNNLATAVGYAEILIQFMNKSEVRKGGVAVLGYGIIGRIMATHLSEKGFEVSVYDKDVAKRNDALSDGYSVIVEREELLNYSFIADGTSEGRWLNKKHLKDNVIMVAPGVPLSLDEESAEYLKERYIHDILEIGTACMVGLAL